MMVRWVNDELVIVSFLARERLFSFFLKPRHGIASRDTTAENFVSGRQAARVGGVGVDKIYAVLCQGVHGGSFVNFASCVRRIYWTEIIDEDKEDVGLVRN
jgi:hypothetical protein